MSGVLHPVGPEPVRVYWLRRVIVLAAAVLALVLVMAIVVNLNSPANASGPEPVPAVVATSAPASTTASAPAPAAGPSTPTPTSTSSGATGPSVTASKAVPSLKRSSTSPKPSSAPKARTSTKVSPSAKPTPARIAACDPAQLRPTLTGKQSVKVKTKTNLDLSLINGGSTACQLALSSGNFTVTISSGRDRIWSTADCTDLVKPVSVQIASEDAYEWRIVWDGRRSKKSCKTRPEIPKAGTYIAIAQFKGTDPVRFRMFLKK